MGPESAARQSCRSFAAGLWVAALSHDLGDVGYRLRPRRLCGTEEVAKGKSGLDQREPRPSKNAGRSPMGWDARTPSDRLTRSHRGDHRQSKRGGGGARTRRVGRGKTWRAMIAAFEDYERRIGESSGGTGRQVTRPSWASTGPWGGYRCEAAWKASRTFLLRSATRALNGAGARSGRPVENGGAWVVFDSELHRLSHFCACDLRNEVQGEIEA